MSIHIAAYHIEHGTQMMYPVDVAHAVGNHPHEWSRVPWTEEARAAALPKLKEKRDAAEKAGEANPNQIGTYDPAGFKAVSPIAAQTGQAPAGLQAGADPLTPPYAEGETKAKQEDGDKKSDVSSRVVTDNDKAVDQSKADKK